MRTGFEADDIIATLTRAGRTRPALEVLISSGDRDSFQLDRRGVSVLYPKRGVSDVARMDSAAVAARYGVDPERYRELAALVGDKSDNLPGVPGVGEKTAAKWITAYGSLDGIVASVDKIKGKVGDNLRAHLDQVLRNHELNLLVDTVELPVVIDGSGLARLGPGRGAPVVRHPGVPDPARPALPESERLRAPGPRPTSQGRLGTTRDSISSHPARRGEWRLGWRPRPGWPIGGRRRGHRDVRAGFWRPDRHRHRDRRGAAAWFDPATSGRRTTPPSRRGFGRGPAESPPRRQTGDARRRGAWLDPAGNPGRHRARRLPRPAGSAFLRPG